jgi:signal transduction histidine kinase
MGALPGTDRLPPWSSRRDALSSRGETNETGGGVIHVDHAIGRLDALSRAMNVGALVLGPTASLEFASPLACELLGLGSQAALAAQWDLLRDLLLSGDDALPDGQAPTRRVANIPLPRSERSLRVETHRLGEQAGSGYLVLIKDRRTTDMLETDLVLASQMRSLAHVYRVLAHDLKGPLNTMQLTLELLADSISRDPALAGASERRHRYVTVLREELGRLDRTLRAMLEQKEPLGSTSARFDLRDVIHEVGRVLLPQACRQRVEMKMRLPDAALDVTGYRDRVMQALLNLALRGLEAMPDGGRLAISARLGDAAAVITIEDTGPGLPAGLLDEIYQLHYTTQKSTSGIGLYMARLVIESHGGELVEECGAGPGARFKLTLPLSAPAGV